MWRVGLGVTEERWFNRRAVAGWGCMLLSGVSPVIMLCVLVSWSWLGVVVREKVGERRAGVWW